MLLHRFFACSANQSLLHQGDDGRFKLLGNFFARNITLKMGQCPVHSYIKRILNLIQEGKIDATDIITHRLTLDEGPHAYDLFDRKKDNCIKVVLHP